MDYLEFYGFNQEPFSVSPVSKFYFNSAQHSKALVRLMYAVDSMKGLAVLIGDIGTGKTTLARRMLDSLPEEEYESALLVIIHSDITADWLLERIALQLGVKNPAREKLKLLNQLYSRLMELYEAGKKAVVLIDEAQMLQSKQLMEEFRGLLNLELPERKLISFVFFGLPELEESLKLDPPLAQRTALKYKLEPLNEESTHAYVSHRTRLAGCQEDVFDKEGIDLIHKYSKGVPRLINIACDNALFEGYLLKQKPITVNIIRNTLMDLGLLSKEEMAAMEAEIHSADPVAEQPAPAIKAKPAAAPPVAPVEEAPAVQVSEPQVASQQPAPEPAPEPALGSEEDMSAEFDKMLDNLTEDDDDDEPGLEKEDETDNDEDDDFDAMFDNIEKK